jgi:antitoxin (DNA-binding transcriptional repressor) of toxin-antitoxin stability system
MQSQGAPESPRALDFRISGSPPIIRSDRVPVDSVRLAGRVAEEDSQPMLTRVAETEVRVRFAELLERAEAGETILVERDGVVVCRLGPPGPACTLDDFTRFLERIHAQGGVREVTESPQRLA